MKELSLYETRVLGALIEKSLTTPDQYPLSLNALTNACNQKSNREPVLELAEATVQETADGLAEAGLVRPTSGFGSRVTKYQHRFCNTEFSELKLSDQELAIVCVLFLRGPQTPGELRSRTARLCVFRDVQEVEIVLHRMMQREDGPLLKRLEREPGRRESRYAHLFSDEVVDTAVTAPSLSTRSGSAPSGGLEQRVEALEQQVSDLTQQMTELTELLDELTR